VRQALPARGDLGVDLVAGGVDAAAAARDSSILDDAPAGLLQLVADAAADDQRVFRIQDEESGR
jgi:hypothetical protein